MWIPNAQTERIWKTYRLTSENLTGKQYCTIVPESDREEVAPQIVLNPRWNGGAYEFHPEN
jgi:hypothetical protein